MYSTLYVNYLEKALNVSLQMLTIIRLQPLQQNNPYYIYSCCCCCCCCCYRCWCCYYDIS